MSETKAQLHVTHTDEGTHLARGIKLTLDGKELGVLKSGKTVVIEIEPGDHKLRIDNTFQAKTLDLAVAAGEEIHYRIWNKRGLGSWMVEILGSGPMYLAIEKD